MNNGADITTAKPLGVLFLKLALAQFGIDQCCLALISSASCACKRLVADIYHASGLGAD